MTPGLRFETLNTFKKIAYEELNTSCANSFENKVGSKKLLFM